MGLIDKLKKHKNSSVAVLLGSGSTINDITPSEWEKIGKCDSWTMNNWIYHPFFVPNFYHLELKSYNFHIFRRRMDDKRESYKDVKFIVPNRPIKVRLKSDSKRKKVHISRSIGNHEYIYRYDYNARYLKPRSKGERKAVNANYKIKSVIKKSYDASLSVVLEFIYRLGYEQVYLFGIDMIDSYYFWTGKDPKYGEVHHQTNKSHENKNPDSPHSASHMKRFVIDFNRRWMLPHGRAIYLGAPKGALKKRIEYRNICELVI